MLCVERIFNLKCLLIAFAIPNLNEIYFLYQKPFNPDFKINITFCLVNLQRLFYIEKKLCEMYTNMTTKM